MSVHKNKNNNTWYVKYKNKTKRGFKSKHEAQIYEAKLKLSNIDSYTYPYIYDLAFDYLQYYQTIVVYGTYRRTKTIIDNIIIPNIKNKRIDTYTELDCRKFRELVNGLNYSTRYKNSIIITFKALFKHAIKYFHLKKNVSYVIESFKETYEEKKRKKEKELNIWNIDEFNRFISCVVTEQYKPLFIVLYYTGVRIGEALALQWCDFNNGKLSISKSVTHKTKQVAYEVKETKNISSIRDIVLGNNLNNYLMSIKSKEMNKCGFKNEWFIFGGEAPLPTSTIKRVKDRAIKKANLRSIRVHDFRHSHASNLIGEGINIVAVSRRLGHSDINMTLKVYTHLLQKNEDELLVYLDKTSQHLLNK